MTQPAPPEIVGDGEALARFVFFQAHVRADLTIKPDALIPPPYPDLSVDRHHGRDEAGIWAAGRRVERQRGRPLIGRADLLAHDYRHQKLVVRADPVDGNPRHAVVIAWPAEKPAQKSLAQQLAARAHYHPLPAYAG